MTSLVDLWDENKYSEGDPIRQLIGASRAYKDWPMDTLAWGADLVDLVSSGLAKILQRRPELARIVKTDLGGNLRRGFSEPGELVMTEGPAPDLEAGRTVGRMLNPALLFAGGQKVPGSSKIEELFRNNPVSEARRQFILGKNKAFEEKANEAIYKPIADIVAPIDEVAQTPVSRRSFLKGAAAGGASAAVGGGLLAKFGKVGEAAPEAVRAVKAAEEVAKVAPTHRYNSLSEYMNDMRETAKLYLPENTNFDNPEVQQWLNKEIAKNLKLDEETYKAVKSGKAMKNTHGKIISMDDYLRPSEYHTIYPNDPSKNIKWVDAFSPQAKKEMKEFKARVAQEYDMGGGVLPGGSDTWADVLPHINETGSFW